MVQAEQTLQEVLGAFDFSAPVVGAVRYGCGHINDTFLLTCRTASGEQVRYILQRMNHEVFRDPKGLMENIAGVTAFLQKKITENGGDPRREALNVIPTRDGGSYWQEADGIVTVKCPGSEDVVVRMDEYGSKLGMCAIALLENQNDETFSVEKIVQFFQSHPDMDRAFNWGLNWKPGRK